MSSPANVKRRRLNDSTAALKKPFVSPLKSGNNTTKNVGRSATARATYLPSTLAHTVQVSRNDEAPSGLSTEPKPTQAFRSRQTPVRRPAMVMSRSKRSDPAEDAARKAVSSLEMQIRAMKNDIDTLKQAAQITNSSTDSDLEDLALKWKLAAQTAAEELFGTVKERVCRMGGVAAWRASEKQKHERASGFGPFAPEPEEDDDADCEFDSQGEELPEVEQEWRRKQKRKARQEMMDAAELDVRIETDGDGGGDGKPPVWEAEGNDDDTFTVDMMLRSLNIELGVIGYEKEAQAWVT